MLRLELIGNLGSDAQVREANGTRFVSFNVAHSVKKNDTEITTWVGCTLSYVNDNLVKYLVKGQCVYVTGTISLRTYKGKDGMIHAGVDCRVDSVQLIGGRPQQGDQNQQAQNNNNVPF